MMKGWNEPEGVGGDDPVNGKIVERIQHRTFLSRLSLDKLRILLKR
jgi:hypothetical protein